MYVEERKLGKLYWPLIIGVAALVVIGIANLTSAAPAKFPDLWLKQLRWSLLGAIAAAVSMSVDYRVLRGLAWPVYFVTLGMLVAVRIVGAQHLGATRWLDLGPLSLQPSEFAKFAVILVLARFFDDYEPAARTVRSEGMVAGTFGRVQLFIDRLRARYRRALAAPPRPMRSTTSRRETGYRLVDLWMPGLLLAVPVAIVIVQPDLGTGLVTTAIGGSMILFAGLTRGTLGLLASSGFAATVLTWLYGLKEYQRQRVMNFLQPTADVQSTGWQAYQAKIAVGSGEMWGKGFGEGTQAKLKFLPEGHTDFAFTVWAEEHGFVWCAVIVVLCAFVVLCALDIAANARDRFGAFLAFGAAALFFWHAFINIGMVMGLLPVVGVPLVLVSYGGSSAVLVMMSIGVLLNVSMRRTEF